MPPIRSPEAGATTAATEGPPAAASPIDEPTPASLHGGRSDLEPPTLSEPWRMAPSVPLEPHVLLDALALVMPAFGGAIAIHAAVLALLGPLPAGHAAAVALVAAVAAVAGLRLAPGAAAGLVLGAMGPLALVAAVKDPALAWNWLNIPIFLHAACTRPRRAAVGAGVVWASLAVVDALIGQVSPAMSAAHAVVFGVSTAAGVHYGRMVSTIQRRVDGASESLWRFQSILHHLPNAVIVQSIDGERREEDFFANQGLRRMLGFTTTEAQSHSLADNIHPDELTDYLASLRTLSARPGWTLTARHRVRHRDGHWLHVDLRATNLAGHPAVRGLLFVLTDVSDQVRRRSEVERQLTWMATHDPLTGLPNRRLLIDQVTAAWGAAHGRGRRVAVLYCDVDHFKAINDSLGHAVGDAVLVEVSRRLREGLRDHDVLSRVGGDEFVALLGDVADAEEARQVASRLIHFARAPITAMGHELDVSLSAGVAVSSGPPGNAETLVRGADGALYAAKRAGRDRVEIAPLSHGLSG